MHFMALPCVLCWLLLPEQPSEALPPGRCRPLQQCSSILSLLCVSVYFPSLTAWLRGCSISTKQLPASSHLSSHHSALQLLLLQL